MNDRTTPPPMSESRYRPHPLAGKIIQLWCREFTPTAWRLVYTAEIHTMVRTNARYGDAVMVDQLSADGESVDCMRLISVSELAGVQPDRYFAIFDTPEEAAAYALAFGVVPLDHVTKPAI